MNPPDDPPIAPDDPRPEETPATGQDAAAGEAPGRSVRPVSETPGPETPGPETTAGTGRAPAESAAAREDAARPDGEARGGESGDDAPVSPLEPREQAAIAFHDWLRRESRGGFGGVERREVLGALPPDVRELLQRMVADLDLVRRRRVHGQPEPGMRLGHYRLLEPIGEGGAGSVWRAEDERLERDVAVKILHPQLAISELQIERFEREARLAAAVDHPNLLRVHDVGLDHGLHFLVTELVPGGRTLADLLLELKNAPPDPAFPQLVAGIFLQICRAMGAVHAAGITHRDLKPNNILLRTDGTPLVADFGLAAVLDEDTLGLTTMRMGTTFYLAPEQITGSAPPGPRSDVFALGVSLYESLVFHRPFEGDTAPLVGQRIVDDEPVAPRRVRPGLPRDLETICLAAMEKDPARRYADGLAMAEDLERFLRHEPITARPDGPLRRLAKLVRRNPARSSLAVAGAVLLALGAAFTVETLRLNGSIEARNRSLERSLGALREMTVYMALGNLRQRGELDPTFLDALEEEARAGLAADPLRLGETLATVAGFADELGRTARTLDLYDDAVVTLESVSPVPRSADEARLRWAAVLERELRPTEAVAVLEPLLERLDPERDAVLLGRALARAHAATGRTGDEGALARLEERHGALDVRLTAARRAQEEARVAAGGVPPDLEAWLDLERWSLAAGLRRGDWPRTLDEANRVLALHREQLGPQHPRTVEVGLLACRVWKRASDVGLDPDRLFAARWIVLSEELLRVAASRLGPRTSVALQARRLRAEAMMALGRSERALELYEDLHAGYAERLGADSPRVLEVEVALALARSAVGDARGACALLEENLRRRAEVGLEAAGVNRVARRAWLESLTTLDHARFLDEVERAWEDFRAAGPGAATDRRMLPGLVAWGDRVPLGPDGRPAIDALLPRRAEVLDRLLRAELEEAGEGAWPEHLVSPQLARAVLARKLGDPAGEREWLGRALAQADGPGSTLSPALASGLLGVLLSEGDPDGALFAELRRRGAQELPGLRFLELLHGGRDVPERVLGNGLEQAILDWITAGEDRAARTLERIEWVAYLPPAPCRGCEYHGGAASCEACPVARAAHLVRGLGAPVLGEELRRRLEDLCDGHRQPCSGPPAPVVELWTRLGADPSRDALR